LTNTISCCPVTAKTILVLLRIAIGWHLLFEGLYKLDTHATQHPWSARSYLQNSEGPAAGFFRRLAPEAAPLETFDLPAVSAYWSRILDRFDHFYGFDADQYESAQSEQRFFEKRLQADVFDDPQMRGIVQQYTRDLAVAPSARTTSERRRLASHRQRVRSVFNPLTEKFEFQLLELLEPDQHALGPLPAGRLIDMVDSIVVWGLIVVGACLMIGLFSRCAAVAGAVLLLSFYAAVPPLPGLTGAMDGTAHYMYVNVTLIESLALLALATTHSGRWAGLDIIGHRIKHRT